jgi:hypothetical protein
MRKLGIFYNYYLSFFTENTIQTRCFTKVIVRHKRKNRPKATIQFFHLHKNKHMKLTLVLKYIDLILQFLVVLLIIAYINDIRFDLVDSVFQYFGRYSADGLSLYITLGGVHVASTLLNRAFLPKEIKSGLRIPYDLIVFSGFIPAGTFYLIGMEDVATTFASFPCVLSPFLAFVYIFLTIQETRRISKIVYKAEMEAA